MAISKKRRFEVFKRDNFTCQYCGRQTPDVILEVDHIFPKAEGGDDDIQNLITSCFDCNHGKGTTPLTENKDILVIESVLKKLGDESIRLTEYGRQSFKSYLKIFPTSKIVEAINIASTQVPSPSNIVDIFNYTCEILLNWRRKQNISW